MTIIEQKDRVVAPEHLTPRKAIRKRCLDCSTFQFHEVTHCTVVDCPLFEHRSGHRPKESRWTPVKAMRRYCLWCMGYREGDWGSVFTEVKLCSSEDCPLHNYRLGHFEKPPPLRGGNGPIRSQDGF